FRDSTAVGNSLVHKRSPLRRSHKASASSPKLSLRDGQKAKKPLCKFEEGQDVLARWSDGLFYLGTIKKINKLKQNCFIIFEDSSKSWSGNDNKKITLLSFSRRVFRSTK
uniref:Tudor domain-containing protein n=1 Tax=Pavo cristatus TaxID=9049 RepID=A0A8C9L618_PAVCR